MSGHSHFRTIKAQKEIADAKRGQMFSKLARVIIIAVKEGGKDPLTNNKLKNVIEQAKKFNMPKENIERAITRGSGELTGENLEEITIEGFGPGGISFIAEGISDNKNRTLGEIKTILSRHGFKIASEGAVKWMFERKGCIVLSTQNKRKEDLELDAIEAGAQDMEIFNSFLYIYTQPEDLEKIKKILEEKKTTIESASLDWVAKEKIKAGDKEKGSAQKLFEELDENDAIQDIYSNLKN